MHGKAALGHLATGAATALLAFPFLAFFASAFVLLAVVLGCLVG